MKKVAIVGSGNIGSWHASRWQALPVELAGFYDADPARAAALASQYGGQAFTSLEATLAASDLIDICTPPALHASATIAAARAGKHVICEKPIARHLADARAMIEACDSAGVRLFIAHVVRFFPEFARAKAVLDSGALGRLGVVRSVRGGAPPGHSAWFSDVEQSGGVMLDVAIHDIDYMRWLCGDVVRVFARGLTFRGLKVDHALITLRFASGAIGHIEGSWAFPAGNFRTSFELAGTEGLLTHDSDEAKPLEVQYHAGAAPASPPALGSPTPMREDPYFLEFQHALDALDSGSAFLVTPHDALEALRVALAAIVSLRTGRPVDVTSFEEAV
ncbi:MAG TPA: Gfo/Idh/MocA family oxidoreductase [Roseiflexaceae bacterium]|nr:Gfo/Idh/MocA family oxidoreductase [Roseiflexaceae bacterium]